MNNTQCVAFFSALQKQNPKPSTELHYRNNFELLIAVILSAQATDRAVNRVTLDLFSLAPCAKTMLALGVDGLSEQIRSLGLYRSKAKHIIGSCEILLAKHGGAVPGNREMLEELPGVGRKTANVILNTAFGQDTIAVDTHIFRVANRTGLARGKTVLAVEKKLLEVIPKIYLRHAHHWLVLHGRYVCKARKPACGRCAVEKICMFPQKNLDP
jgi:endonuclease III